MIRHRCPRLQRERFCLPISKDVCLEFFFSGSDNPGSHLPRFLMAIVRVEVSTHSQQNFVHPFPGLGFCEEQPTTDAAYPLYRFPLLDPLKKLKSSRRFAHGDKFRPGKNRLLSRPSSCNERKYRHFLGNSPRVLWAAFLSRLSSP